jgi:hypothetical protein
LVESTYGGQHFFVAEERMSLTDYAR